MAFETFTLRQRSDLQEQVHRLNGESWPTFLLHGDVSHWESLFDVFADYQILFCEPADTLIAAGHTIPFVWDGTLEDLPSRMAELMERAIRARHNRSTPNTLSALAALVTASHQRRGLSTEVLRAMRSLAEERGMHSLIQPVRIDRERNEGRYEDPNVWMRHPIAENRRSAT